MNEKAETKTRKKNGAHTNSCTTVQLDKHNIHVGCCLFSHKKRDTINFNTKSSTALLLIVSHQRVSLMTKEKKNGAHTHVRTTVQLVEHNIHVGCCLFSHEQ